MDKLMKRLGSSEIKTRVLSAIKNAGFQTVMPAGISTIWGPNVFTNVDSAIWGT